MRYCCLKTGLGTRFGTIFDRFSGGPGPQRAKKVDFSPTAFSVNNDKYEKYPSRTHAGTPGNEIAHGPAHAELTPQGENIDFLHADFWPVFASAILLFTLRGPIGAEIMVFQYLPGKSEGT